MYVLCFVLGVLAGTVLGWVSFGHRHKWATLGHTVSTNGRLVRGEGCHCGETRTVEMGDRAGGR